jgi:hypothetical protein
MVFSEPVARIPKSISQARQFDCVAQRLRAVDA